jgi:SAM-dependent methyltransferase/uncharacterized protein YbaR (Trm112 family)
MKKQLIEILICPSCLPDEAPLEEEALTEDRGDIIEGRLRCKACGRDYPIHEGIAFLDPAHVGTPAAKNRYETAPIVSSYLWSHYCDLLNDPNASEAYGSWAELMEGSSGRCLDIGSAVGRFSFDMSAKFEFVVGLDNSLAFVRAARELMLHRHKRLHLADEGDLTFEVLLELAEEWQTDRVEFIVGDALALPFASGTFSALSSLNLLDKVPYPIRHLTEMNRTARRENAQFLFSDPFSWSEEVAERKDWLGGKENGAFSGKGLDNVSSLLKGENGLIQPPWETGPKGDVWWKIRTHTNHFELIRSRYLKATR